MLTLWDLLPASLRPAPRKKTLPARPAARKPGLRGGTKASSRGRRAGGARGTRKADGMQARYDQVVALMLAKYGVRVRRWRSGMSGVAWTITYRDGTVSRLIESPKPRGPMSAAVFMHEIGHHALGIGSFKPRCLEEYHAWAFAIREMEASGLNVTEAVHRRMRRSLEYAVRKAVRRGLQALPKELAPYASR